ncbi:alcohol dehydrogenase, partial [Corallococcus exiguus]|nr:alcohol dehydrogenase [Corallococcus exiguus]
MTVSPRSNWNYPTPIRFGAGRIAKLAEAWRAVGMSAPLIVTDTFLATQSMTKAAL